MLEWYEAYADYRDTMDRMERLVARVAEETLGTTTVDVPRPRDRPRRAGGASSSSTRSTRARPLDARRGRAARAPRRARRRHARTTGPGRSSSTTRSRTSSSRALIQPTILHDYPVELSPFARATDEDGHRRAVRVLRRRDGARQRLHARSTTPRSRRSGSRCRRPRARAATSRPSRAIPDYVEALSYGMPPTGGLGMGIDRLAMVLLRQGLDPRRDPLPGAARAPQ